MPKQGHSNYVHVLGVRPVWRSKIAPASQIHVNTVVGFSIFVWPFKKLKSVIKNNFDF